MQQLEQLQPHAANGKSQTQVQPLASRGGAPAAPSARTLAGSAAWLDYFQRNAAALRPIPWHAGVILSAAERAAVAESVATFQLGETGGGRHLTAAAARYAAFEGDDDYLAAIKLFIAEEQRHGRELGRWLDLAGIPRIERHWSNGAFRRLRQLAGLELMISFLLTAEVMAKVYYAALRKATRSVVLQALCEQILKDEVAHIRFQSQQLAILRSRRSRFALALCTAAQRVLFGATALVVWQTHRRALRAGGLRFHDFWRKAALEAGISLALMEPLRYAPASHAQSRLSLRERACFRGAKADNTLPPQDFPSPGECLTMETFEKLRPGEDLHAKR
ncbi:MAG TPA: ferritin-like domain-containing protein [Pirellulales bacterium]|nr:ferritin-like domain-containing protein [Pirellulales bacterium]